MSNAPDSVSAEELKPYHIHVLWPTDSEEESVSATPSEHLSS